MKYLLFIHDRKKSQNSGSEPDTYLPDEFYIYDRAKDATDDMNIMAEKKKEIRETYELYEMKKLDLYLRPKQVTKTVSVWDVRE